MDAKERNEMRESLNELVELMIKTIDDNRDLIDACEAAYSYLKTEGKETSLLGLQISETLKKAKS